MGHLLKNVMMKRFLLFIFLHFVILLKVQATHNRAGEITYRQISGLTYEFTITTYTKESSVDADRNELVIFWGDGTNSTLPRTVQNSLGNDIKLNRYVGTHTYSGPFNYVVYVIDPNRIESILNISNSVNVPFYIEDTLKILDPTIYGFNNSPILLNPPIDFGNVNEIFVHNPNAYDPDGDSLSYRLIPPKQGVGSNVPGYTHPNNISPGPDNIFTLNPFTGELRWDTPKRQGIYNVAILITEYRNGQNIGTIVRDLQIIIQAENNQPPIIEGKNEICVVAGDTINEIYTATDPNSSQFIIFSSNGAPYILPNNKAEFYVSDTSNPASSNFYWQTTCEHLRNTNYQIVVKAEDNARVPLVDLKTVTIKVLAPAPSGFTGTYSPDQHQVILNWDENYSCKSSDKFQGYSIWRKVGCGFQVDSCNNNLSSFGYVKIGETTANTFTDTNIERGKDYSYVIVADFASKSSIGLLYNKFTSIASEEVCIELPLNIPFIYHVDVKNTDENSGEIYVEWSKPSAEALDTIVNPGPYVVKLYRIDNESTQTLLQTSTANTYSSPWDTTYLDTLINTVQRGYTYILEFYVAGDDLLGTSSAASSIFFNIIPSNETLRLQWSASVPWTNEMYNIYLQQEDGSFVLIDSSQQTEFIQTGLSNDSAYCYKIESIGSYQKPGLKSPLINFSQIVCAQPKDTLPPCAPILRVENFCTNDQLDKNLFINYLSWDFGRTCQDSTSNSFLIYYKENIQGEYRLLDSIVDGQLRNYEHILDNSLTGCYQIIAVDEVDNRSPLSNEICVSDCPIYELPNTFTPNGDGINDLYTPIKPYSGVSRIDMKIFTRMGNQVFQTSSPDIEWNGTDQKTGKELPTGVFYYVCEVYFETLDGEKKLEKPLNGYIHLLRDKK